MTEQQSDYMQGFYRGRAEGIIVEQERIIKAVINNSTQLNDLYSLGLVERAEELLMALIKGENK